MRQGATHNINVNITSNNISSEKALEEFLEEVRLQFARKVEVKEKLDAKANNLITMAGAVTTLFLAFGAFILKELNVTNPVILGFGLLILVLEVVITIIGIWRAISAYRLRSFEYPMHENAFINENTGELDPNKIDNFVTVSKQEFQLHMINEYLESMKTNSVHNSEKADLINQAYILYLISLIMIVPFAFTIVAARLNP